MRSFLLLILMGGLLWLVVSTFGGSEPEVEAGTSERDIEAVERPPASGVGEGGGRPVESLVAEAPPVAPRADPVVPEPEREDPEPKGGFDEDAVAAALAFGNEIELARYVLHERARLKHFLETSGRELPQDRKDLAVTFALGLDGRQDLARQYAERFEDSNLVSPRERALVETLLEGRNARPMEAGVSFDAGPLVSAVELAMLERAATQAAGAGRAQAAADSFSMLLRQELDAGWEPQLPALRRWSEALLKAQESHRWNKTGEWPSVEVRVEGGDNLTLIRKRFLKQRPNQRICTGLIDRANELHGRYLQPGETLRIPLDEVSVLVDLSAHWMFYLHGDEVVASWEVGVGKQGSATRPGHYVVGKKQEEPTWFPSGREPIPFGDPEHAIGTRWIAWNRPDGSSAGSLGFHGTNDPDGVGQDVSNGCVRMHNADVEALFEILPVGAPVEIRP